MPKIKHHLHIIGLAFLIGLTFQVSNAHALYSPRLTQRVGLIKQHMMDSQAQNGPGSVLEEVEQFKAYDKARRQTYEETGISGNAKAAQDLILSTINLATPVDSLFMVFNYNITNEEWISNCLRDEIWSLETLRDKGGSEMMKAYLLRDTYPGALLADDYTYLTDHIRLLKKYGSDPKAKFNTVFEGKTVYTNSNKYFFGEEPSGDPPLNYYSDVGLRTSAEAPGCPDGAFSQAFQQVARSAKTFKTLATGGGVEWGSIWAMAEANARLRAREWIRANQISLTVGGEAGGSPRSLIKGGGWAKFKGSVKTQLKILENMVGPVTPLFEVVRWSAVATGKLISNVPLLGVIGIDRCVFYDSTANVFRNCDDTQWDEFRKCEKNKEAATNEGIRCDRFRDTEEYASTLDRANRQLALQAENAQTKQDVETTFTYSLTMDSVAEQNIYFMDEVMWDMNSQIQRGYEGVDKKAGKGIPTITYEVGELAARQCPNKQ